MNAVFYLAGLVAVVSTAMVITRRSAAHAVLYLVVSLLSIALLFFLLGAPFVGALEIIVYAGAIMVLFVFVIMMLNLGAHATRTEKTWLHPRIWIGPALLALVLVIELAWVLLRQPSEPLSAWHIGSQEVARTLFGPYVLAVELASFLLLAGLVGAYHLAFRPEGREGECA